MTIDQNHLDLIIKTLPPTSTQLLEDFLSYKYSIHSSQLINHPEIIESDDNISEILSASMYLKGNEYMMEHLMSILENKGQEDGESRGEDTLERKFVELVDEVGLDDIEAMQQALEDLPEKEKEVLMKKYYAAYQKEKKMKDIEESFKPLSDIKYSDLHQSINDLTLEDQSFIINTLYNSVNDESKYRIVESIINNPSFGNLELDYDIYKSLESLSEAYEENRQCVTYINEGIQSNLNESEGETKPLFSNLSYLKFLKYID